MDLGSFVKEFEASLHGVPPGSIEPSTKFQDLGEWESVALLNVIGLIDIEFNTQISANEIMKCQTVEDVYTLARQQANT
jgi:acyl carrier protein